MIKPSCDPLAQPALLLVSAHYFVSPTNQLFLHPVLEPRVVLDFYPPVALPPTAIHFEALRTQQAFTSSLTAAAVGHNLPMILDIDSFVS
jgi:hypothetical protein